MIKLVTPAEPDDQWWCECRDSRKPHIHCPWGGMHIHIVNPEVPVMRACGERHSGVCWTERFARWSVPGARIPPEYRRGGWYLITAAGRVPRKCR